MSSLRVQGFELPTILFHTFMINKMIEPTSLTTRYFNSVFTKSTCDLPNHNNLPVPSSQLFQIHLHIIELWEVFSCIAPSKHLVVIVLVPKFGKYVPQVFAYRSLTCSKKYYPQVTFLRNGRCIRLSPYSRKAIS